MLPVPYCIRCEVVPRRGWGVFGTNDSTSYITSRGRAQHQLLIICNNKQIVANNNTDVPDYRQDMRHSLEVAGILFNLTCAKGAAIGIRHFHNACRALVMQAYPQSVSDQDVGVAWRGMTTLMLCRLYRYPAVHDTIACWLAATGL